MWSGFAVGTSELLAAVGRSDCTFAVTVAPANMRRHSASAAGDDENNGMVGHGSPWLTTKNRN